MTNQHYRPDYKRIKSLVDEAITLDQHEIVQKAISGLRFSLNVLHAEVETVKANLKEPAK